MPPLSAYMEDFWFIRLASLQDLKFISSQEQFCKTVATVYHLCMVYGKSRKVLNVFETLWHIAA